MRTLCVDGRTEDDPGEGLDENKKNPDLVYIAICPLCHDNARISQLHPVRSLAEKHFF